MTALLCHLHYCERPCAQCARAKLRSPPHRSTIAAPSVITFKPAVFEHLYHPWETPHVIDTPQELRQECIKRDLYSKHLHESLLWRSGRDREW